MSTTGIAVIILVIFFLVLVSLTVTLRQQANAALEQLDEISEG